MKSLKGMRITKKAALRLLKDSDLLALGEMADTIRRNIHPEGVVTFVVDRNINYTNVCINRCRFCAFYRDPDSPDAYLLTTDDLCMKIDETIEQGGTQILLQGGLHPRLDIEYYIDLLKSIKRRYAINVHGFSPPEICYLADRHDLTVRETLEILKEAGLDSVPGGGAEILSDRIREILSPRKIKTTAWLRVMEEAHRLGMRTTATMMFGSIEEPEDIVEHLDRIRSLQDRTGGFTAFIPWSFQPGNTELVQSSSAAADRVQSPATAVEYLRILSLSRVYLDNIANIQASWVTQGLKLAQVALRFGANDFGSTMIEENVVSAAGNKFILSSQEFERLITGAGYQPRRRNTRYELLPQ